MAFAKFQENRFRIYGEIAENHAILVNLTASIVYVSTITVSLSLYQYDYEYSLFQVTNIARPID